MKPFKLIISLTVLMSTLFGCGESTKQESKVISNDEPIEIEFIKEGELDIINNDSIIQHLDIEIAQSNNERAIGLMNRSHLEDNQGMLFIFDQENISGFYMKDTRIPLDIIFIGTDKTVITITPNRQPFDLTSEGASSPYQFVLEVNGGKAEEWGIKEGVSKIRWREL